MAVLLSGPGCPDGAQLSSCRHLGDSEITRGKCPEVGKTTLPTSRAQVRTYVVHMHIRFFREGRIRIPTFGDSPGGRRHYHATPCRKCVISARPSEQGVRIKSAPLPMGLDRPAVDIIMACSISTFPLFPLLLAFLSAPPCHAATSKVVERASKTCPIFRENLLDDVMFLQAANQDKVQVCRCLSNRTTNRFTYGI